MSLSATSTPRPGRAGPLLTLLCCALLSACSSTRHVFDPATLAPLQFGDAVVLPAEVLAGTTPPDLLAVNDAMREFVATYTEGIHGERSRLIALHTAVKSAGALDMQYDPFADGTAEEAFERGTANCLSFANLFVALAREAGLKASYQWIDLRPEWQRIGERVALRLHVNVIVKTRDGAEYMVDIDPLRRHEIAGSHRISDREAQSLYYSNRAMQELSEDEVFEAWAGAVRALQLAPGMSHLWVNLGAIYRHVGQYAAAERAYFRALAIDATDRSAMNNLVVMYELTGRDDERSYWLDRLHRYRDRNPYYHANMGDIAARDGDWAGANVFYARAVQLQPEDSELIYGLAITEHRLGNLDAAERLMGRAIEAAQFEADQRSYRIQLRALREERAASL